MKEYEYLCFGCNRVFTTNYKKVNDNNEKCFCSNQCRANQVKYFAKCDYCDKEFYINWTKRTQSKKSFCSKKCYWEYKKKTGYGSNKESLNRARKKSNTRKAIEKRRQTKIQNGSWLPDDLIVDGITFKQYKRKVYRITKQKREELKKSWNGYDYYDGEYIRENYNLSPQNGDYPSIDHLVSLQYGFKNKISPLDLCKDVNLVFTKRRINSSKREKCEKPQESHIS